MFDYERSAGEDVIVVGEGVDCRRSKIVVAGRSHRGPLFADALPHHLYDIVAVGSAVELFAFLCGTECDLIIVDHVLGDSDGISLLKSLSLRRNMAHLLVRSETDEEIDRVLALELGADDCVALSCGTREIRARVGALMRRRGREALIFAEAKTDDGSALRSELAYAGWIVNRDRRQLYAPTSEAISLTNVEYQILISLFSDPGIVRDRASMRSPDAGDDEYDSRALDVFVSRLRKKMGRYGGQDLIETVRGRGYRLATVVGGTV